MEKLFYTWIKTDLHINFYTSVLPIFKSFVLVFEQKEPMVHRLHDSFKEVVQSFLCCFMQIEVIKKLSSKKLASVNVKDKEKQKPISLWYFRNIVQKTLASLR